MVLVLNAHLHGLLLKKLSLPDLLIVFVLLLLDGSFKLLDKDSIHKLFAAVRLGGHYYLVFRLFLIRESLFAAVAAADAHSARGQSAGHAGNASTDANAKSSSATIVFLLLKQLSIFLQIDVLLLVVFPFASSLSSATGLSLGDERLQLELLVLKLVGDDLLVLFLVGHQLLQHFLGGRSELLATLFSLPNQLLQLIILFPLHFFDIQVNLFLFSRVFDHFNAHGERARIPGVRLVQRRYLIHFKY